MSAFGIFAMILTTGYIIYYAVIIWLDIVAGRKKAEGSSNIETFDTSSFQQEESIEVREVDGGYQVGESEVKADAAVAVKAQPQNAGEQKEEKKTEEPQTDVEKIEKEMQDVSENVEMQMGQNDFDYYNALTESNGTSHLIYKQEVAADKPIKQPADDVSNQQDTPEERDYM